MPPVRISLILSLCLAQDAPEGGPPTCSGSVEQGWKIAADGEVDFPTVQESDLVAGLIPKFTLKTSLNYPVRDRDGRVMVKPKGYAAWKSNGDPLKMEASLTLHPDGACALALRKVEYSERVQRVIIEFEADKVRTVDLGGKGKWQGSRAEWSGRL